MEFILIDENLWGIVDESFFRLAIINNQLQWDIGEDVPSEVLGACYETILWFEDGRNYFNKTSFK
jgi:hypothetical protein